MTDEAMASRIARKEREVDRGFGVLGHPIVAEAAASVALDGETQSLGVQEAAHEGFGCPGCGLPLRLDSRFHVRSLVRTHTTLCCGYAPNDSELGRWIRAAQLLRERGLFE